MHSEFLGEVRGSLSGELFEERLQLGVGRRVRYSRPQTNARLERYVWIAANLERGIHIGVADREPLGHHANDRVILMNELQSASNHARIRVVVAPPEGIAEQYHGLRVL